MHPRLIHRRSTAQAFDVISASTVVSTSFADASPSGAITFAFSNASSLTFDTGLGAPTPVFPLTGDSTSLSDASPETVVVTVLATSPLPTSSTIPQSSSAPLSPTSLATSTVYQSTETITMTTQLPQRDQSPLSSSTPALTSRDGIIILALAVVAVILIILSAYVIWRRCRRRDQQEALEYQVDPISFHQSNGKTDSFVRPTNLRLEALSPLEFKNRVWERDTPSYMIGRDSAPSSAISPTRNTVRFSPTPDAFDSRWPGRLVPLIPSGRVSSQAVNSSQAVGVSGDPSMRSDVGSGSQAASTTTSNLHLARLDSGNAPSGSIPLMTTDVIQEKRELERRIRLREANADGETWDEPPPESEKAESMKDGPPAYSPGSKSLTHTIPPLPLNDDRPLPDSPTMGNWRNSTDPSRRRFSAFRISLH